MQQVAQRSTLVAVAFGALVVLGIEVWAFLEASGPETCGEDTSGVCFPVMEADPPWWLLLVGGLVGALAGTLLWWAFRSLRRSIRGRRQYAGSQLDWLRPHRAGSTDHGSPGSRTTDKHSRD